MSPAEELALVDRFLRKMRAQTQWGENRQAMAPGDFTPYLQMVATATLGTLWQQVPEGKLEVFRANAVQGEPLPAKWWTFTVHGQLFDMEGPCAFDKVERELAEQVKGCGLAPNTPYRIQRDRTPDIEGLFAQATGNGLDMIHRARQAFSREFDAPRLQANTLPAPPRTRVRSRL